MELTDEPIDRSQLSYSWADMAGLTHATQVEIFNWCGCEDGERQYDDCPQPEVIMGCKVEA